MAQYQLWQRIPTSLTLEQFEEFVLPHLPKGSRSLQPKLSLNEIFNYILKLNWLQVSEIGSVLTI
jgi:hypothetical protein